MHASTALAAVLVDELVRCGVREVVLAPGSRSAPLAYAVQAAERAGRLRLHVRVDERSAGFLALGLAKVSRRPAVVITTSGTAVANLHPAVLEASHADVPLIVLSADRPDELRGTGANQTTVQPGIFAGAVRWQHDLASPWGGSDHAARPLEEAGTNHPAWRTTVGRAWSAAIGAFGQRPGPTHLNVAFRDPLAPEVPAPTSPDGGGASDRLPTELSGRPGGAPWTVVPEPASWTTGHGRPGPHDTAGGDAPAGDGVVGDGMAGDGVAGVATLMVLGDLPDQRQTEEALAVAAAREWPVVAEPFGVGDRTAVLPHGSLLLTATDWLSDHLPERVIVVGRCTLNRETGALLRRTGIRVEAVATTGPWVDPSHAVHQVHPWEMLSADLATLGGQDRDWAQTWRAAGAAIASAVSPVVENSWPSGPALARQVLRSLSDDDLLVLGSSNAARDVDRVGLAGRRLQVTGNRGLAGIDGTNATAVGLALSAGEHRRTVALVGDLTFLHDLNGLLIGPTEPRPDLTIVVVNDDGGGIFGTLEYGEPDRAPDFERIFGTPTGADLQAACAAYALEHVRVDTAGDLRDVLARPSTSVRVIEVAVPRDGHRRLRADLARTAADALA